MAFPKHFKQEDIAQMGRKGGQSTSDKKSKASSASLAKARAARWPGRTISASKPLTGEQEASFFKSPMTKKTRTSPSNILKPQRPPRWLRQS